MKRFFYKISKLLGFSVFSDDLQKYFFKNVSLSFFLKVTKTGLGFLTSVLLTRILGTKDYGIYAYAISWISLLTIPATVGFPPLLTRDISKYKAKKEWKYLRGLNQWTTLVVVICSLIITIIGFITLATWDLGLDPNQISSLKIALFSLPVLALIRIKKGVLRGLGNVIPSQYPLRVIYPGVFITSIVVFYFVSDIDSYQTILLRIFSFLLALITAILILGYYFPSEAREKTVKYDSVNWIGSSVSLLVANSSNLIVGVNISVVVLGTFIGTDIAGVFKIVGKGASLVSFVLGAFLMPLGPKISELHNKKNFQELQKMVTNSSKLIFYFTLPLSLLLVVGRNWFLLIFGENFLVGSTALILLIFGRLSDASLGPVGLLLDMTDNEIWNAFSTFSASLINVVLNVLLVPLYGIEGAGLAMMLSIVIWNSSQAVILYINEGIYSPAFRLF